MFNLKMNSKFVCFSQAQLRHPNAEKLTTLANLCTSKLPENNITIEQRQDFDPYSEY